jgi:mannobiose 2-epimerase
MLYETPRRFEEALRHELETNLIPFWLDGRVLDQEHGGFIGLMSNDGRIDPRAPKALILNTRLLWTYSRLYRYRPDPAFKDRAQRAYDALEAQFRDRLYGGAFWQVDFRGQPQDDKKKIYGQAFAIYSLCEYSRALGIPAGLEWARQVYERIEAHSRDQAQGGYIEVCNRDWSPAEDSRLSDKDMDEKKSMNNHLHLLEAYSTLYAVWADPRVRLRLAELLDLFRDRIINPRTGHLCHFFDETWRPRSEDYTFGHDIEASWLLCEAAEVLGDEERTATIRPAALRLARVTLAEGFEADGGLCYRGEAGRITDPNREWWPQAEAVVGFLNARALSGDPSFLEAAQKAWAFIDKYFVDREHGEWFWRIDRQGRPDPHEPKVSSWKEPYHGVRACLEAIQRLSHDL